MKAKHILLTVLAIGVTTLTTGCYWYVPGDGPPSHNTRARHTPPPRYKHPSRHKTPPHARPVPAYKTPAHKTPSKKNPRDGGAVERGDGHMYPTGSHPH